jgi:outer membrane biosynthesis protein TonB
MVRAGLVRGAARDADKRRTLVVRRNLLLAWSFGLVASLSFAGAGRGFAQEAKEEAKAPVEKAATPAPAPAAEAKPAEAKKEEPKKEEAKPEAKKEEPKKEEAKPEAGKEAAKAAETPAELPPPTVPPEVEAKLEAARHAVAEAIVAAQDAGLVESSIDPPPILDILIQGYAVDARTLKNAAGKKPYGVSPEVFGAWFTGFGKLDGVNYQSDVRIMNPSAGLKTWYNQRASILNRHIEAVRKAKGPAPAAPKAEEAKKAEEPKAEAPKDEPKPEAKKEEPAPAPKAEAPKAEEPKAEAPKSN